MSGYIYPIAISAIKRQRLIYEYFGCRGVHSMRCRHDNDTFRTWKRLFSAPSSGNHESVDVIKINWINKDKSITTTKAKVGSTLLTAAHACGIDIEGACEGVCACSTCHVILENDVYDKLPPPSEEEEDMLDQAFGLTATSRLGCQVTLTKDLAGMKVQLPLATRNFYVDGHKPKPH